MAKKVRKEVWQCTVCKGQNVQIKQTINPNTNEVDNTGDLSIDDCWCQDCEEHTELKIVIK